MMLDDDLIDVVSKTLPPDSTLNIGILHGDGELHGAVNILHAGDGATLGIHLSIKKSCSSDIGSHVSGVAVNADIVTGGKLISGGFFDEKVWLLDLGESDGGMVRQTVDIIASIIVVIAVAAEGGVVTEVLAVLLAGDGLVDRVDGLEDLAADLLVEAELAGLGHTVDLHVVDAGGGSEAGPAGEGLSVHGGEAALARVTAVLGRPGGGGVREAKTGHTGIIGRRGPEQIWSFPAGRIAQTTLPYSMSALEHE